MKAIVRRKMEPGHLFLEDAPMPGFGPNEALIEVKAAGVCGTDHHVWLGRVETDIPVIVGHEMAGVVAEVGKNVTRVKPGDHVVSRLNIGACGVCRPCVTGNPQQCDSRTCPGYKVNGVFADYFKIDETMLVKVDKSVPFADAALIEPMAVLATGMLLRAKIEPEDVVVVFGPGPIGLIGVQMARMYGAARIIVVGTTASEKIRLPLAKKIGADYVMNSDVVDVEAALRDLTGGKGVDLVVEASGAVPAINAGIRSLRRMGRVCQLGNMAKKEGMIAWQTALEKSLAVAFTYSTMPVAWNMAVSMLERNAFDAKSIITHSFPLADFARAFDEIASENAVKCVLIP